MEREVERKRKRTSARATRGIKLIVDVLKRHRHIQASKGNRKD